MTLPVFDPKDTTEKDVLVFDFSARLPEGVTLTGTPTVAVTAMTGTDAAPSAILNGQPGISGGTVLVPVQGGVDGVNYAVKVTVATSSNNLVLSLTGVLPVEAQ